MSRDLQIDFSFKTQQGVAYWWVIFVERLSVHGFHFENPNLPNNNGTFYYSTADEIESIEAPFSVLWEKVLREEPSGVHSVFWHRQREYGLTLGFGFECKPELQQLDFSLTLPGGDFAGFPLSCAEKYLHMIVQCTKEMLDLCAPHSVEITWEDSSGYFAPWASLNLPSRRPVNSWERILQRSDQVMCSVPLSNGQLLYYLNPVPISRPAHEWDFVFLSI